MIEKLFLVFVVAVAAVVFLDRMCKIDEKLQPKTPVEQALQEFIDPRRQHQRYHTDILGKSLLATGRMRHSSVTSSPPPQSNIDKENSLAVVFYNIFIPVEKDPKHIVNKIIREQLGQIQSSTYYKTVYYNLIGYNLNELEQQSSCASLGLDCIRLQHLREGNEVDTLESLYDFCATHTNHTVVYIHDKGSFHKEKANRKMRRVATKAAVSDPCALQGGASDGERASCNVCASRQQFNPHWHAPSNMWSAKCDYIQTLIPPREYERRRLDMFLHLQQHPDLFPCLNEELLNGVIDPGGISYLNESRLQPVGLGRFAYETWVYSSPHLSPCHVVDKALSEFGKGFTDWTPRFMEGPGMGIGEYRGLMKLTWFHKQGRLWEMAYMYNNATPSAESWFWKTYRVEKANAVAVC